MDTDFPMNNANWQKLVSLVNKQGKALENLIGEIDDMDSDVLALRARIEELEEKVKDILYEMDNE